MVTLVPWNFTIPDSSPLFTYKPYGDGQGLGLGWQTWYTGSGFNNATGASPAGDSFHLTSLPGASVSLSFYGTGITLRGTSNCTYTVTLDNNIVPTAGDGAAAASGSSGLFATAGLAPGPHVVTLSAEPTGDLQVLSFGGAVVQSAANGTFSSPQTVTFDNQNSSIVYGGTWQANKTASGIPSAQSQRPFHTTSQQGASAHLNFTGRAVAVYGSTTFGHGIYTVQLDGKQTVLDGTSVWLLGNALLFYQDGLDEGFQHSLNLTDSSDGQPFSLNSVVVTQFNPDNTSSGASPSTTSGASQQSSSSSSNAGKIVGPIVAVLGVVVIASLLYYLYFMKRRSERGGSGSGGGGWFAPAAKTDRDGQLTPFMGVSSGQRLDYVSEKIQRRQPAAGAAEGGEQLELSRELPPSPSISMSPSPSPGPAAQFSMKGGGVPARDAKSGHRPPASVLSYTPGESAADARAGAAGGSSDVWSERPADVASFSGTSATSPVLQEESLVDRIVEMVSRRIDPRPPPPQAREGGAAHAAEDADADAVLPPYRE